MHRDDPINSRKARQGTRHAERVIRAPRGTERTAKSWLTEAALRMIQNNLDPEVAENPKELVVYGGIGRAARNWECFDAILAALRDARRRRIAADPVRQAGRRVQDARRRAARAHRQLQPRAEVGDVGALQRARPQGPDDVRPDDGRLVDLHRQPGHRAGHLRDVRRGRAASITAASSPTAGSSRPAWAAWAARSRWRRRWPARRCSRSNASRAGSRCGSRPATSIGRRRISTTRSRSLRDACAAGRRSRSACSATPPRSCPSSSGAACVPTWSPIRRPRTISSTATCRPAGRSNAGAPRRPIRRSTRRCPRRRSDRSSRTSRRCSRSSESGVPTFDYGNNIRQVAHDEGVDGRVRVSGLRSRLHPPAVLRRQGTVPLGRAVRRSGGHLQDRPQGGGALPRTTRTCTAGSTWRASGSRSRACPRASAGWGSASGTSPASPSTRW